jgi:L-asparaginase II
MVQPVLVRQARNGIIESEHRGSVVVADVAGRIRMKVGDPDVAVLLRSAVKPFGAVALVDAGGIEAFGLSTGELAVICSSHAGEDIHAKAIRAILRRASIPETALACGVDGTPQDAQTAARLARARETPGLARHMCSGQHAGFLLLSRINGWSLEEYWLDDHPSQRAFRSAVARCFGVPESSLVAGIDGCGIATFAFPLRDVARAYALLADPGAVPPDDGRRGVTASLTRVRDAMLASPQLVSGTHDRLPTELMEAVPGSLISKIGVEALRGMAILPGSPAANGQALGVAVKIADGDPSERALSAVTVATLADLGVLSAGAQLRLDRYLRPRAVDSHGRLAGEAVADIRLA